jgi:hypothetical protein
MTFWRDLWHTVKECAFTGYVFGMILMFAGSFLRVREYVSLTDEHLMGLFFFGALVGAVVYVLVRFRQPRDDQMDDNNHARG